jgi:hypothetical protein
MRDIAAMASDLRARAEARLIKAAEALDLGDPRPPLRERLKRLRETHPEAFASAVAYYESTVLPALAGADAVSAWVDYGRFLGELTAPGELTRIDADGRASAFQPPLTTGTLVLFIPEDGAAEVLPAVAPRQPSAAQRAAVELLVHRRLELTGD